MIEEVDANSFSMAPRRKQVSGEEYFETEPMESEYNHDTTNRVFVN